MAPDRDQVLFRLFGKFCPEGTILYTEGSPGEDAYLVRSGRVRLAPAREDGAGELEPGAVLGEESFFGRAPRRARAEIVADTRLLEVGDRNLDSFVRHGPEEAGAVMERLLDLAGGVRAGLDDWTLAHLARRAAPLLRDALSSPVRIADVAECPGVGPAGARRLLDELARRGVLALEESSFRASDAARLERTIVEVAGEHA